MMMTTMSTNHENKIKEDNNKNNSLWHSFIMNYDDDNDDRDSITKHENEDDVRGKGRKHALRPWDNNFHTILPDRKGVVVDHDNNDKDVCNSGGDDDGGFGKKKKNKKKKKGMGMKMMETWGDLGAESVATADGSFMSGVSGVGGKFEGGAGESLVGASDKEDDVFNTGNGGDKKDRGAGNGRDTDCGSRGKKERKTENLIKRRTEYEESLRKVREMSRKLGDDGNIKNTTSKSGNRGGGNGLKKKKNAHVTAGIAVRNRPWPRTPYMNVNVEIVTEGRNDGDDNVEKMMMPEKKWTVRMSRKSVRVPPAVSLMETVPFPEHEYDFVNEHGEDDGKNEPVGILEENDVDMSAISDAISHVESISEKSYHVESVSNDKSMVRSSSSSVVSSAMESDYNSFGTLDSFGSTALDSDLKKAKDDKRNSRMYSELAEFPHMPYKKFDFDDGEEKKTGDHCSKKIGGNHRDEEDPLDIPERMSRNPSTVEALVDLQRASARVGDELLHCRKDCFAGVPSSFSLDGQSMPTGKKAQRLSRALGELHLRGRFFRRWNHRYVSVVDHAFFGPVLFLFKHDARGLRSGRIALKNSSMIVLADSKVTRIDGRRKDIEGVLFQLHTAKRKYLFAAPDPKKRGYWIDHLTTFTGNYDRAPLP